MVERQGGKSLNTEASWSPLFGGAQREGKSLNQEASWRPLFGGAQGGEKFKANERYHPTHPPNPPQATCVPQISVCSKLILIGFPLCSKMTLNGHFPVCSKMTLIVCSKMTRVPKPSPRKITIGVTESWYKPFPNGCFILVIPTLLDSAGVWRTVLESLLEIHETTIWMLSMFRDYAPEWGSSVLCQPSECNEIK